ncbi:hypothetical protein OJF2_68480 [Aquisphaera giovannonii]|uniref:Uncharacterized protein n=1 Tax=Aquisphaera giovannonii TaxID=406548 RepID=A0A5B9WED4_9BACT|nr:hypothetical protein [Aquisphaera giovannonii]QEH38250.1 hypothetical protein OJF2_68480 [Aquisphaera giovannonii]
MIGNSPGPAPSTPSPDLLDAPGEAARPPAPAPPRPAPPPGSSTSSGDEFYALLAEPAPDPFLQGGSGEGAAPAAPEPTGPAMPAGPEPRADHAGGPDPDGLPAPFLAPPPSTDNGIDLPVVFTPPPDSPPSPASHAAAAAAAYPDQGANPDAEDPAEMAPVRWRSLLLASYASAVTLALIWILWTGRGLRPTPATAEPAGEARAVDRGNSFEGLIAKPSPPLPPGNIVALGSTARLGGLEVVPSRITLGEARLERLEGTMDEFREVADVLILRLRLRNLSEAQAFAPLEAAFARDSGLADDGTYIETADGRRIPMYRLAVESEWSFPDQPFTTLKPGAQADTVLVSQPVRDADLAGPFTWHVKLRTEPYRTDVLGVRFQASDIRR